MDQDPLSPSENPNQPPVDLAGSLVKRGNRLTGLSSRNTLALVGRVFRQVERSQVWVPNVGSLSPHMVARFSGEVAQRYPDLAKKYQTEPAGETGENQEEMDALVLAPGGFAAPAIWQQEPGLESGPPELPQNRPERPETSQPTPPAVVIHSPAPIQRRANVRPLSRVEEIKPGSSAGQEPQSVRLVEPRTDPKDTRQEAGPQRTETGSTPQPAEMKKTGPESGAAIHSQVEPLIQRRMPTISEQVQPLIVPDETPPVSPSMADFKEEGIAQPANTPDASPESTSLPGAAPRLAESAQSGRETHEPVVGRLPLKPVQRQPASNEPSGAPGVELPPPAVVRETAPPRVSEVPDRPDVPPVTPESFAPDAKLPLRPPPESGQLANIQRAPSETPVVSPRQEPPVEVSARSERQASLPSSPDERPLEKPLASAPAAPQVQREEKLTPAADPQKRVDHPDFRGSEPDKVPAVDPGSVLMSEQPPIRRAAALPLAPTHSPEPEKTGAEPSPISPPISPGDNPEFNSPTAVEPRGRVESLPAEIRRTASEAGSGVPSLPAMPDQPTETPKTEEKISPPAHSQGSLADTALPLPLAPANRIVRPAAQSGVEPQVTPASTESASSRQTPQPPAGPVIRHTVQPALDEPATFAKPAAQEKSLQMGSDSVTQKNFQLPDIKPASVEKSQPPESEPPTLERSQPSPSEPAVLRRVQPPANKPLPLQRQFDENRPEQGAGEGSEKEGLLPLAERLGTQNMGLDRLDEAGGSEQAVTTYPDILPVVQDKMDKPLIFKPVEQVGRQIDRKPAAEPGPKVDSSLAVEPMVSAEIKPVGEHTTRVESPQIERPGIITEPFKTQVAASQTAPEPRPDLPEPAAEQISPQKASPLRQVPAVDLGQSLLTRAAIHANLPVTARSTVMQRRAESENPDSTPSRPGVFTNSAERRGPTLLSSVGSQAVLPQARFDLQRDFDPGNTSQSDRKDERPTRPLYAQAVRHPEAIRRRPAAVEAVQHAPDIGKTDSGEVSASTVPPVDQIQRLLAESDLNLNQPQGPSTNGLVQRALTAVKADEATGENQPERDLDQLARQVYPLIKRMLAVERERYKGR